MPLQYQLNQLQSENHIYEARGRGEARILDEHWLVLHEDQICRTVEQDSTSEVEDIILIHYKLPQVGDVARDQLMSLDRGVQALEANSRPVEERHFSSVTGMAHMIDFTMSLPDSFGASTTL